MMLTKIVEALKQRSDLAGWTVRHVRTDSTQVYAVPQRIEAQRAAQIEQYLITVLRRTSSPDGAEATGSGNVTLLPGSDIGAALERAVLTAGLVTNPVYGVPGPADLPDVPLLDSDLKSDAGSVTGSIIERIRAAASAYPEIEITAAECFGEIQSTHLVNSRGIDAEQEAGQINMEFCLHSQRGEREVEVFTEMRRRRVADFDLERIVEARARQTQDLFEAAAGPSWQGPVILQGGVLATFMAGDGLAGGVLQNLGSAEAKYARLSPWEIGKTVFRGEVRGDPLTVWANRCVPFGTRSSRFDDEGLPAQRVELIRENRLAAFAASQRYAEYLGIPATGAFGGVEVAPGSSPAFALLAEPYVEIVQFSWFNPNTITGEFASEIRFGYLVENGTRKPFRGGQLIGNVLDALADVRWSAETGQFGTYLGPRLARFNQLKIAGQDR